MGLAKERISWKILFVPKSWAQEQRDKRFLQSSQVCFERFGPKDALRNKDLILLTLALQPLGMVDQPTAPDSTPRMLSDGFRHRFMSTSRDVEPVRSFNPLAACTCGACLVGCYGRSSAHSNRH